MSSKLDCNDKKHKAIQIENGVKNMVNYFKPYSIYFVLHFILRCLRTYYEIRVRIRVWFRVTCI